MPKSDCPGANGFHWQTGYIYQDLKDVGTVTTVSLNSQLKGRVSAGDVEQYFCIKNDTTAILETKRPQWPPGEYCIYQKGSKCPSGLLSGWIMWNGEDGTNGKNKNAQHGVLPEGVFNQDTKIYFCCKSTKDGYKEPIELPFASPFYLMAFTRYCQDVLYTIHKNEYITYDKEDFVNQDGKSFPYPYGADLYPPKIYYCYYRECAWTMTALNGTFWSPYYPQNYNNKAWCKWHIKVPWNYAVLITFEDVSLTQNGCNDDFVNVQETFTNGTQVLIGSICETSTPQIRSSGNNVTVVFRSDATVTDKGFQARYQAIRIRAAKTTTCTTLASTQTSSVNDKASTTSLSAETTQEMSSTRVSKFSSREKTDHISAIGTEDISKTKGEGFSDTLDNESESAANTSLIAALSASLVVICVMVAVALFCFHKKRSSRKNENWKAPTVSFRPYEKAADIYSDETVKESENVLYESDSMTTSARNTTKESENPLYTGGTVCGKTFDAGMYESVDQRDLNQDEGIYSSLYESIETGQDENEDILCESMDDVIQSVEEAGSINPVYEGLVLLVCCATLWPSGRYGLPMAKSGCPGANGFHWQTGYIYQDLENNDSVTTISPNSQLKGRLSAGDVEQYFCIKDDSTATLERNRPRWPAGEYCIYQKGYDCPYGLLSGWVYWDDEDGTNKNSYNGVLPEGVFDHDTKIFYCCQNTKDGYKEPIKLPFASPFYLIAFRPHCQEVLHTIHKKEYIKYDTENYDNRDRKSFPYPFGADFHEPQIYYCYYRECAWTMTTLNGTFWSPYYPQNYNNKALCKWHIKVPWNYAVLITFEDVSLEWNGCNYDFVNVRETFTNGTQVLIGSVCETSTPQIRSSGNNVTVVFRSDATVSKKGFKARYQAIRIRAAETTTSATFASTQTSIVDDKASTTSSSAETTEEISSTRERRFSSREKADHISSTMGTEDISKTRGEGFSDTLDNESAAANTSLIAALSASLVVICAIVTVALFCFHKKRDETVKESDNPLYESDSMGTSARNTIKESENPLHTGGAECGKTGDEGMPFESSGHDDERNDDRYAYANSHGMYNNSDETVKESDNPLYKSDSMSTSERNTIEESENPLYTGGVP
ncbi:Deleted in malignant brain tumors 1 protein [Stylophora pistillata]|uniref:Deleted in malignant brain tumors 1 protein n=1 Tax=Stylophora pistillata TaxID=50429 RepID=A0A2B4S302_STYPI|nr:Deleted in malignant brain tumors 1 protein [Stylophora pistillata]